MAKIPCKIPKNLLSKGLQVLCTRHPNSCQYPLINYFALLDSSEDNTSDGNCEKIDDFVEIVNVVKLNKMEEICLRFPHISEQIFEVLNDKTLVQCKEANRTLNNCVNYMKGGKFPWLRIIQKYIKFSDVDNNLKDIWKIFLFEKRLDNYFSGTDTKLKKFAIAVFKFFDHFHTRVGVKWSPIHIAAEQGHLYLCWHIASIMNTKHMDSKNTWTPMHFTAQAGNLDVFKFLSEKNKLKNPETDTGITPLHLAALNGHLKMYQFIAKNTILQDYNDITPLHLAAANGHLELVEYITKQQVLKRTPTMNDGTTPLHLAAKYGHFEVCEFICNNMEEDVTKLVASKQSLNREHGVGVTPLNLAISRGEFRITKLITKKNLKSTWKNPPEKNLRILLDFLLEYFLHPRFIYFWLLQGLLVPFGFPSILGLMFALIELLYCDEGNVSKGIRDLPFHKLFLFLLIALPFYVFSTEFYWIIPIGFAEKFDWNDPMSKKEKIYK